MAVSITATGTNVLSGTGLTTFTYTGLTVPTGQTNTALVVLCNLSNAGSGPLSSSISATWGGTNIPAITNAAIAQTSMPNGSVWCAGLIAPTTGNQNLVVSWTGAAQIEVIALALAGVDQTGGVTSFPHGANNNTASASSLSVAITSATGNLVFATAAQGAAPSFTSWSGTGVTSLYIDNGGASSDSGAIKGTGAATVTPLATFSGSGAQALIAGFDVLASVGGGPAAFGDIPRQLGRGPRPIIPRPVRDYSPPAAVPPPNQDAATSLRSILDAWQSPALGVQQPRQLVAAIAPLPVITGTLTVTEDGDALAASGTASAVQAVPPWLPGVLAAWQPVAPVQQPRSFASGLPFPALTATLAATQADETLAATGTASAVQAPLAWLSTVLAAWQPPAPTQQPRPSAATFALPAIAGTLAVTETPDTLAAAGTASAVQAPLAWLPIVLASWQPIAPVQQPRAFASGLPFPGLTATLAATQAAQTLAATGTASAVQGPLAWLPGVLAAWQPAASVQQPQRFASGLPFAPITGTLAATQANETLAAAGTASAVQAPIPASWLSGALAAWQPTAPVQQPRQMAAALTPQTTVTGALALTEAGDALAATGTASAVQAPAAPIWLSAVLAAWQPVAPTQQPRPASRLPLSPVAGTLAATQANQTLAASGAASAVQAPLPWLPTVLAVWQPVAPTQQPRQFAAAFALPAVIGTLAVTETGDTLAAGGIAAQPFFRVSRQLGRGPRPIIARAVRAAPPPAFIAGTLTVTEAGDALAAAGTVDVAGGLTVTQANETLAGTGGAIDAAALAVTQANETLSAAGGPVDAGALIVTQADETLASTGAALVTGQLAQAQTETLAATGSIGAIATAGLTLVAQSHFFIGFADIEGIIGGLTETQADQTVLAICGDASLDLTEAQTIAALRSILLGLLPCGTDVIRGEINRVPEPQEINYVVLMPSNRTRLETNIEAFVDGMPVGRRDSRLATEVVIQIDVHGPLSGDNVQMITTLLRDEYVTQLFARSGLDVQTLYTATARQTPFENAEQQTEFMWSTTAVLQANPVVTTPQDFADEVKITPIDVDTFYPL